MSALSRRLLRKQPFSTLLNSKNHESICNRPLLFLYPQWAQQPLSTISVTDQSATDDEGGIYGASLAEKVTDLSAIGPATLALRGRKPDRGVRKLKRHQLWYENRAKRRIQFQIEFQKQRRIARNEKMGMIEGDFTMTFDWRIILHQLREHTAQRLMSSKEHTVRLSVPLHTTSSLISDEDQNIWEIAKKSGCVLQMHVDTLKDNQYGTLSLQGPANSVVEAFAEVRRIITTSSPEPNDATQKLSQYYAASTSTGKTGIHPREPSATRTLVYEFVKPEVKRQYLKPERADKVPRPEIWTQNTFAQYVWHLTSMRLYSLDHLRLYDKREQHQQIVANILLDIFTDPECTKPRVVSTAALNDAFTFLAKYNKLTHVRGILAQLKSRDALKVTTQSYNILLEAAAKQRNLHTFNYILSTMIRRGQSPDAGTWLAFIRAVDSPQIKLQILKSMHEKGLTQHPQIMSHICYELVQYELDRALQNNVALDTILQALEERYGPDWLSIPVASRVIHRLCLQGMLEECWKIFEMLGDQIPLAHKCVHVFLVFCSNLGRIAEGFLVLHRLCTTMGFVPLEDTYSVLFTAANKSRLYATARTIWRFACVKKCTTFEMRSRIISAYAALADNLRIRDENPSVLRLWKIRMAPFVTGSSSILLTIPMLPEDDVPHLTNPETGKRFVSGAAPDADMMPDLGKMLTSFDINMYRDWEPVEDFTDVLLKAQEIDSEWTTSGARYTIDAMMWLENKAPEIWVRSKGSAKVATVLPWKDALRSSIGAVRSPSELQPWRRLTQIMTRDRDGILAGDLIWQKLNLQKDIGRGGGGNEQVSHQGADEKYFP